MEIYSEEHGDTTKIGLFGLGESAMFTRTSEPGRVCSWIPVAHEDPNGLAGELVADTAWARRAG